MHLSIFHFNILNLQIAMPLRIHIFNELIVMPVHPTSYALQHLIFDRTQWSLLCITPMCVRLVVKNTLATMDLSSLSVSNYLGVVVGKDLMVQ